MVNELARSCLGNDLAVWPLAATGRDLGIRCSRGLQLYYDGKTVTDHEKFNGTAAGLRAALCLS